VKSIDRRGTQDSGVDASLLPRYGVADVTAESRVFDFDALHIRFVVLLVRNVADRCAPGFSVVHLLSVVSVEA